MVLSLPRREADLDIEQAGSQVIVHDRKHDYVHILNERAFAVLQACDGAHSCNDIARELSYRTREPYEGIAGEVVHLVGEFADLALVESAAIR
jgi:hypothetical protein